jgi:ADP-ribosylglycohydrolase
MVSDDTEHTVLVGHVLLQSSEDPRRFAVVLARELRWWLLGMPAGAGLATLRASLKLWVGFSPANSGVWSAGNGPAMRSALIGVCLADNPNRLRAFVRSSTRLTHTDPRAERGAMLVALAARHAAMVGADAASFFAEVRSALQDADNEITGLLAQMERHLARGAAPAEFVNALGLSRGVTGYIYHSVPAALFCWLRFPGDFRRAVAEVISLGGDTDTTAAITGAIAGATVGSVGIPADWLSGLCDWPWSVKWLRELAASLAGQFAASGASTEIGPPRARWMLRLARNAIFAAVVLAHGIRRLLPPY